MSTSNNQTAMDYVNPFGLKEMTGKSAHIYTNVTTGIAAFTVAHFIGRFFGVDLMTKAENLCDSITGIIGIKPKMSRVHDKDDKEGDKLIKATAVARSLEAEQPLQSNPVEHSEPNEDLQD